MKILMVQRLTLAHGIRGGMETQAAALAHGLAARGNELTILTTPHPDGRTIDSIGGIVTRYQAPGNFRRYDPAWWSASHTWLATHQQTAPFDILVSQGAGALGYLPHLTTLGLPSVVILHGTLGTELRTRLRDTQSPRGIYRLARFLRHLPAHTRLWRRAGHTVTRWIAISAQIATNWHREIGVPNQRIATVPNGINTERFAPNQAARIATRAKLGIAENDLLLISIGRLEQNKGVHIAVQALAHLPPHHRAHLLVIGDGSYRPTLERMITAAGLNTHIQLLGYRPNDELPHYLAAADLFVMPSLCHEGFPLTILEALATGLPVLATHIGGIPDAIDDGRTGHLLPMGDVPAWTAAIAALANDPRRRRAMGILAHTTARTHFSHDRMINATEHVLRAAIDA